ncbi:MAG: hypothetical protein ABW170_06235 [Candidatus Thiodiazotropha sp. L084R]
MEFDKYALGVWIVCGGMVKLIAYIDVPVLIQKILDRLKQKEEASQPKQLPESRVSAAEL